MFLDKIYSNDDVMLMKHLAEVGIDIDDHYLFDIELADAVFEKNELIRKRMEHIDVVIELLRFEKDMLNQILGGILYEFADEMPSLNSLNS